MPGEIGVHLLVLLHRRSAGVLSTRLGFRADFPTRLGIELDFFPEFGPELDRAGGRADGVDPTETVAVAGEVMVTPRGLTPMLFLYQRLAVSGVSIGNVWVRATNTSRRATSKDNCMSLMVLRPSTHLSIDSRGLMKTCVSMGFDLHPVLSMTETLRSLHI